MEDGFGWLAGKKVESTIKRGGKRSLRVGTSMVSSWEASPLGSNRIADLKHHDR
jgi:hypothetical protein